MRRTLATSFEDSSVALTGGGADSPRRRAARLMPAHLRSRRGALVLGLRLLTLAVVLAIWELVRRLEIVDETVLPTVVDTAKEMVSLLGTSGFWSAIGSTASAAIAGLGLAVAVGIPVGIAIGTNRFLHRSTRVLFEMFRATPYFGLLPVLILLLGVRFELEMLLVASACVWPVLVLTADGSRHVDSVLVDTSRSYQIPRWLRVLKMQIPNASPYIGTGLRISIALSILIAIGVETITQLPGIGQQIMQAQVDAAIPEMYAYIIYAGFLGIVFNAVAVRVEMSLLRWHPSARPGER